MMLTHCHLCLSLFHITVLVCGLLLPPKAQPAYFALRAFNAELASIKDGHNRQKTSSNWQSTTDYSTTLAMQLRMQWWQDALASIYDQQQQQSNATASASFKESPLQSFVTFQSNPVVRQLQLATNHYQWTRRFLERLIDARFEDLELQQYNSVEQIIHYSEETVSSLLYLTLEVMVEEEKISFTPDQQAAADLCLSHAGIGVGLATTLRATPFRFVQGECPLPAELFPPNFPFKEVMEKLVDDGNASTSLDASETQLLNEAIRHVANEALVNLHQVRSLQGSVPKPVRACLLPVVPAMVYLEKLQAANYNLFEPKVMHDPTRLRLLLFLARTWLTGVV
jgi:NADH dehydrogenase [ubiquinone] 1 alpha subcomplex assembly factor 6